MLGLFSPIRIRSVEYANRIGVSPMCMYSASAEGLPSDWHAVHLGSRAVGGAGLVLTEATAVSPEGRITDGDLGLWNNQQRDALEPIATFIRGAGPIPGIQLAHAGRKGGRRVRWAGYDPIARSGWGKLLAPSCTPFRQGWLAPCVMASADIDDIVCAFASSAERAVQAGFEAIELHFAHGYLAHQFLSPLTNFRTDGYGGSLQNRGRFAVEITQGIRSAIGDEVPIFARLSVVDWACGGVTLDEAVEVSRRLLSAGADVIDCSSGAVVDGEKVPAAPHYQVDFATRIRNEARILTAAVGLIREPVEADSVISKQKADFVFLGRASLQDAYWPRRAAREVLGGACEPRIPLPYRRAVETMSKATQW
jgi:2,4-dienoyl-CoA reductase-like NADH-dependent reductase (Old Yellow Enzyme family)